MKEVNFFKKGLFETKFMSSRIKTHAMSMKEKILGFFIGPFGTAALMSIVNSLMELYYTDVFYIDNIFGDNSYLILAWVTKIVAIFAGLFFGYIVEHNVSKEGKIRPLLLIGSLIYTFSAFFLFFIPNFANQALKLVWVYIFNILCNSIGYTLVMLKINLNTLCTRDQNDRNQVNVLVKISEFMLVGTGVNLTVGAFIHPTFLVNQPAEKWYPVVLIFCIISFILSFVHYFYTKERITEDNKKEENNIPLIKQIGYMFKSKYWVLAFVISFVLACSNNMQGANLNNNFCAVILGGNGENQYTLIYTIMSGVPLGLGLLFIYPLCKKLTIRKTSILFSIIVIISCILGWLFKDNFIGATICYFFTNFGTIPVVYILYSLIYSANDEVEYKYGFRVEGTMALAITTAISNLLSGVFSGVYETGLSSNGYFSDLGISNPASVKNWIYFTKYVVMIITYLIIAILLVFLTIEKNLPMMQEAIEERHKKEALERGEVYISPEELKQKELEENAKIAEEWRIQDLKEKCAKKGLDFEIENQKYLTKKKK